ncbi:hypothetical protein [Campylobacter fetus]|uniref:Uncharacterized protein n=1 Tax=Campylobacter fetus TaxID=196 RepID=A0A825B9L4_CAMFE|nr:hypothetical protein [Campylobacter fetus]EAI8858927.1 hypothetical protein [Campylobacter fetus]KGT36584.1 hypothetical protein KU70_04705 [Campylobacter fetus]MBD3865225.1 hypothetical protein [Campylobacter fetus]
MDRMDSYDQYSNCGMDSMDPPEYITYRYMDILDLMLQQDEILDYILSTPQFEEYLQDLAKSIGGDLEEAKEYFEDNSWSEIKEFVLENKDIQEDLNKKLTIDFDKLEFKLSN